MKQAVKTIVLLDTHALLHRAYHALPDFRSSNGEPTGALYGLLNMILKLQEDFHPEYIIACYDLPGGTFRTALDKTYKATRSKTDDDLVVQLQRSRDVMDAFGIPWFEKEGYEADDLLGTLSKQLAKKGEIRVVIVTGDMDTLQLVEDETIVVYTLKKGITDTILYTENKVVERFGFLPEFIPDFKGLRGDPSDNIIGIKGIGEKTATTLISHFHTIENIYRSLAKGDDECKKLGLTDRIISLLKEGEEEALFSKTLARIIVDVPIEATLPSPWRETRDLKKAYEFCEVLEFRAITRRIATVFGENSIITADWVDALSEDESNTLKIMAWLLNAENTNPTIQEEKIFKQATTYTEAYTNGLAELSRANLLEVFKEIEEPIIPLIRKMREHGIMIDRAHFQKMHEEYVTHLSILEKKIGESIGTEVNIKSPKQLSHALFEVLNLPKKGIKKGAQGLYSTDSSVLEKLADIHPVIRPIMEYREWQKLLSTYIDAIPQAADENDIVHSTFIQYGTATGRFSSEKPNMQNIPTGNEAGERVRAGFIARPGFIFVSFDFSQLELRLAALLSGDPILTDIFITGQDVHTAVAAKVFAVDENSVTSEMRRKAKVINFGILYGMGVTALQKNLGTNRAEAEIFLEQYFSQFKGVKEYLEQSKEQARTDGFSKTLFGRIRPLLGLRSKIPFIRAMNERIATNAPIQGTEADMMKLGARFVDEVMKSKGFDSSVIPILQIHDELLYEIKTDIIEDVIPEIVSILENVLSNSFLKIKTNIPFPVHVSIGPRFGDMEDWSK